VVRVAYVKVAKKGLSLIRDVALVPFSGSGIPFL